MKIGGEVQEVRSRRQVPGTKGGTLTRHVIARITVLCKIKESMPAKDSLVSGSPTPAHSNLPFNLRYQRPPPSVRSTVPLRSVRF